MVLSDDRTFMARLLASWNLRADDLRQRLAQDPTNDAAWLWTIRLRVCDYLMRRYGESVPPSSTGRRPAPAEPGTGAPESVPPSSTGRRPAPAEPGTGAPEFERHEAGGAYEPSSDAAAYRARFRGHCQDALTRIEASADEGRRSALETGDALVESIRARHARARQRELLRRERLMKRKRTDPDRKSP